MVESKLTKYGGLSRREYEMRKKMAERFGNKVDHLKSPEPEDLHFDSAQLYSQIAAERQPKQLQVDSTPPNASDKLAQKFEETVSIDTHCKDVIESDTGTSQYQKPVRKPAPESKSLKYTSSKMASTVHPNI